MLAAIVVNFIKDNIFHFISFLADLDCVLRGLILKACWPFGNENDPTHIIL